MTQQTKDEDWTKASRLKSISQEKVSRMQSDHSLVKAKAKEAEKGTPEQRKKVTQAAKLLASYSDYLSPEKKILTASNKQADFASRFLNREYYICAAIGGNRCLAEGTLVATSHGPKPIEEIEPCDIVFDENGNTSLVVQVFENGEKDCVRLTNRNETLAICTEDHVFLTKRSGRDKIEELAVRDFQRDTTIRRVEVTAPLGDVDEPHAYAIGALLGDGCCKQPGTNRIYISSGEEDVVAGVAGSLECAYAKINADNYTYSLHTGDCHHYEEWMKGRGAHEKTVDMGVIRTWNRRSLLAFVAGLVDTDGSVYRRKDCGAVCLSLGMQAKPVMEAAKYAFLALWQLNVRLLKSDRKKYVNGPMYEIKLSASEKVWPILEELNAYTRHPSKGHVLEYERLESPKWNPEWTGVEVEPFGRCKTYDLQVANDSSLYLLGNGLVSHNSGKTYVTVHMAWCMWMRDKATPGELFWCVSPTFEKSITLQGEIYKALPKSMLADQVWTAKNGFGIHRVLKLHLPNGGHAIVKFKSEDQPPESFESDKVSGILIDETVGESLYQRLHARLVDMEGWMLISTIPDADWMIDELEEAEPEKSVFFRRFCILDNEHNLGPRAIQRFKQTLTEEEYQMRFLGNFRFLSGLVYKEFIKEHEPDGHLCKPFAIPSYWPKWRAMDWGNAAPTACVWVAMSPNGTMYVYNEYYERGKPAEIDAKTIKLMSHGESYQTDMIIDPACFKRDQANMSSIADEFAKCGLRCIPGIRTNVVGMDATVQRVKHWLLARHPDKSPMFQVFDTCKNLISEFRRWKYKEDRDGKVNESIDRYDKKNDHALDSLRYLICANPRYETSPVTVDGVMDW